MEDIEAIWVSDSFRAPVRIILRSNNMGNILKLEMKKAYY